MARWQELQVAKEQEEEDVGLAAKQENCRGQEEQEATKGGSCAACKCTKEMQMHGQGEERKKKEEEKRKIGNCTTSKRVKELEPMTKFPFLIH